MPRKGPPNDDPEGERKSFEPSVEIECLMQTQGTCLLKPVLLRFGFYDIVKKLGSGIWRKMLREWINPSWEVINEYRYIENIDVKPQNKTLQNIL